MDILDFLREEKKQEENPIDGTIDNYSILVRIKKILEIFEEDNPNSKFFEAARKNVEFIADFYEISFLQAFLFSHFVGQGENRNITMEQIAKGLRCKPIDILIYQKEIDVLRKRKLLVCRHDTNGDKYYHIPYPVMDSLKNNTKFILSENKNLNIFEFFNSFNKLVDQCIDDEISIKEFAIEINTLIDNNPHLAFSQAFKSYHLKEIPAVILAYLCERLVNNDESIISLGKIENLFSHVDMSVFLYIRRTFGDQSNVLFSKELIKSATDSGFANKEVFTLSDKAKKELLAELDINHMNAKRKKGLILFENIKEKRMYYNPKEEKAVNELASFLMPGKFNAVLERLKEHGMRTGFACIFYGESGTGKTETVNMIAKKTGRNIMMVDISRTKSCWFGESEKKIKEVFDTYKTYVEASEITPILLLNEADGIIGKRKDVTSGNVAQTENAIQNIILQELENLNGILIATTNLTQNMDKAFERRFLYKIEFTRPSLDTRKCLWKELIPDISDNDAYTLAERFHFTGGQIENIARKRAVDFVLSEDEISLDRLIAYCQDEKLDRENDKIIGFHSRRSMSCMER